MGLINASTFFLDSASADKGNGAVNILYDNTVNPGETPSASAPGTSHRSRNDRVAERVRGYVQCTGQDVTLTVHIEIGGAWAQVDSQTITAGADPADFNILELSPGWQLRLTNGGTGPTTLNAVGWKSKEVDSGV